MLHLSDIRRFRRRAMLKVPETGLLVIFEMPRHRSSISSPEALHTDLDRLVERVRQELTLSAVVLVVLSGHKHRRTPGLT